MKRMNEHTLSEWLVVNSQLGDRQALCRLCELWRPKLLRYSIRQLGNEQRAEEAVQSTFEVITRDLHKLKDSGAFAGWAYQILHRKGVDYFRQTNRIETIDIEQISDENVCTHQQNVELENVLSKLSTPDYLLVHLYYLEGFNITEISALITIPPGTVKSRLHAVRNRLKTILEDSQ